MYKKTINRLLVVFLFIFISVSFLIPSDLVAETRKFWVKDGHYENQKVWVTSGYFKDTQEKRWVDTSYMKSEGHWETKKEWVDTSHMVYQGYWKNVSKSFWVDTSQWVSSGYWKDVTERVWVKSGYTAYRDVKKWVDTSHSVYVRSGYWTSQWINTSHSVYVRSGYWTSQWINTSHWETRYRTVRQAYRVYVRSGYWKWYWSGWSLRIRWIDTSHWETRYRNVRQAYRVWVSSGYWSRRWVDTSHWTWVKSGYWKTDKEAYWVDTSHWEDQKVWVAGHYETRYKEVEDWQPCNVTFVVDTGFYSWWRPVFIWHSVELYVDKFKGTINGTMYKYKKYYTLYGSTSEKNYSDLMESYTYVDEWGNTAVYTSSPGTTINPYDAEHPIKIRYVCYEVLNGYKKESYSVWVPPDYKKEWVDTSHLVKSGYWQSDTYTTWVDTSYMKSEGHWETKKEWVDTSHMVYQGYWKNLTKRTWVDTSHYETRDIWVDTSHWVEAELDQQGKVLHTNKWNENRIKYNISKTGDPDNPRGYEIFFNGEKFVLECDAPGDFQPESVHVEFLGTGFETNLTKTEESKWEGYIWDESFIYFHDRDCVFRFTASYDYNGDKFEIDDEVAVYIVRDYYWQLHRLF